MAETMVPSPVKSELNSRKNKKPLMEKRRRARINSCLTQLKSLVLQAIRKDSSQFSKLEKADILELTVKHLRGIQRQQAAGVMAQDPLVVSKYRAGFNECAKEVVRYMGSVREVNDEVKDRVMSHLAGCLHVVNHVTPMETLQHQHHQHQLSQQQQQHHLKPLHVSMSSHPVAQQQPINAGGVTTTTLTAAPPSILLPSLAHPPASLHSGLAFNASPIAPPPPPPSASSSPPSSPASSPKDCSPNPPSPVSGTSGLPALSLQAAAAVSGSLLTAPPTTVLAHHTSPPTPPITGAFKIVPSSVAAGGAVALFLGNNTTTSNSNNGLDAGVMSSRPDAVSVDALPLYSVALPHNAVTAFVTPPPTTSHMMTSLPSSASSSDSGLSNANVSPPPAAAVTAPCSLPVDLRQSHKMKSGLDSKPHQALPFVNCGMVPSPSDDKLWRPW